MVVLVLLLAILLSPSGNGALAFNSEEHKLIADLGASQVLIPPGISLPASVQKKTLSGPLEYIRVFRDAKAFAVGVPDNSTGESATRLENLKQKATIRVTPGLQDECYPAPAFSQRAYNMNIRVPSKNEAPTKILYVGAVTGKSVEPFSFGELVALYGDYRSTVFADASGNCYLTNRSTDLVRFPKPRGEGAREALGLPTECRDPVSASKYLRYIASGLVPPERIIRDTASSPDACGEAGWWGDEMLRIANVNDWHFSSAGIAWYVGMHRLALHYVDKARTNPDYWATALHYEASALHSLTDLFALGHVVANRDETTFGFLLDNGARSTEPQNWKERVIAIGGGRRAIERDALRKEDRVGEGRISLDTGWLEPITELKTIRDEALPTGRKDLAGWLRRANKERKYHNNFNESGGSVKNLDGVEFTIYGDGKLHEMDGAARKQITEAVRKSVQSLMISSEALKAGKPVREIGSPGSPYFAALRHVPVFIVESKFRRDMTNQWARYAMFVDQLTGAGVVPADWETYSIPYLGGEDVVSMPTNSNSRPFPGTPK
ncbi:MAG: hypothetical protein AAB011_09620 [Candidatus Eisenbacteria bacterium]